MTSELDNYLSTTFGIDNFHIVSDEAFGRIKRENQFQLYNFSGLRCQVCIVYPSHPVAYSVEYNDGSIYYYEI